MTTLLGLDVGTTGCKAVLFDEDGTLLASASREYAVDLPQPGWAEQDIERVWALAMEAMGQAIATAGAGEVAAIGLSVHGEAVTPVDAAWRPLRPTILGMDTRTGPQNDWLRERFGGERLFERTGMPIHTVNTLPKLLWIRRARTGHLEPRGALRPGRGLLHRAHDRAGGHQRVPGLAHAALRPGRRRLGRRDPGGPRPRGRPAQRRAALRLGGRHAVGSS